MYNKLFYSVCSLMLIITCAMPINKVEARGEGAVAFAAAGIGMILGAAIASDAHHKAHYRYCQSRQSFIHMQQQTMNYVLMNYNPAFHDGWVRYVVVDCSRILNPVQQEQLLNIMNQRRDEMRCRAPIETREFGN